MGAWDVTAFGNDEAADMVLDLLEHADPRDYLAKILAQANATDYLEAPEGSQIVAAAAIVAAARNRQFTSVPADVAGWVGTNGGTLQPLAAAAREALARVRGEHSELRELWEETDEFSEWIGDLDKISSALL